MRPNADCMITPTLGHDVHGAEQMGTAKPGRCAVVKLSALSGPTSVRTDSSASRGSAQEKTADARLLFAPGSVSIDDQILILGRKLRVISIDPRVKLGRGGKVDHDQVDLLIWV